MTCHVREGRYLNRTDVQAIADCNAEELLYCAVPVMWGFDPTGTISVHGIAANDIAGTRSQ